MFHSWSVPRIKHSKYPEFTVRIGEFQAGGMLHVFRKVKLLDHVVTLPIAPIVDHLIKTRELELRNWLQGTTGRAKLAPLAGVMYEQLAHSEFCPGNKDKEYRCRDLADDTDTTHMKAFKCMNVFSFDRLEVRLYLLPFCCL